MALWRPRVGLDLGAVHRDGAELDQAHLARQAHDLHEQVREFQQVKCAKVADRAVDGEVACGQHPECHVLVQLARDPAWTEYTRGVAVDQHLDHHDGVERLVARAGLVVARVEGAEVESVNCGADEVRQVPFGQPLLQRLGQQQHLLRFIREVVRGHAVSTHLPCQ